ncbi:MAG: NHLP family bacteriocin export ABC transporter peptidase/permease/ATPase subunit [Nitrospirae bacterium]|nr:NHLP family bacteriocin export ABC transporter peptidase/permease/ATPase subunit [Nitrospirota bacterium]
MAEAKRIPNKRAATPTVLQMEAVECGAAALAMILGYYGLFVPLEKLRMECGVSRDGSKASNMLLAARKFGLIAKGFKMELEDVYEASLPAIVFWNFNHFVVLEGFKKDTVFINDPGSGPRRLTLDEFDSSFTGVILTFDKGPDFKAGGEKSNMVRSLARRLRGSEAALLYVVITNLLLVVPGIIIPIFSKIFVDDILVGGMKTWIYPLLWGMAATALLNFLLTWIQQYYLARLETKFSVTSSSKFLWHVLRLPIEFFTQRYAGDISNRVSINDRIATLLSGTLATNMINLMMILFYAVVMFFYDIVLTLIAIGIALINFIFLKYISRSRVDVNKKLQQEKGKLLGAAMDGLQTIETLKATGAESDFFAKWAGYQAKAITSQQALGISSQRLNVVPVLLTSISNAVILTVGGLRVIEGSLSVGMLVAFQSLMTSFITPINQIVSLGGTIQETEADINRLDDVLKYEIDPVYNEKPHDTEIEKTKLQGYMQLKDVSFGYSRLEPPLIENFNLNLRPGSRVALVGGSGSGKSTIGKLIAGVYEPWSGEILFDNTPRKELSRLIMTNSLTAVDQDIFLFNDTIRNNITLWDSTIREDDVINAAKDACIHDDIAARDGGYKSMLDEGGLNFSGGQRQRLEIARALVLNPTIVVLDEATSALDPRTEMLVDEHLRRRGCTCVIVAHRLSTIRDCEEIIVLEKGKIVQRGTHEELIQAEGLYSELIKHA